KDITMELAREALRDKIRSEEAFAARAPAIGSRAVYTAPPATKFAERAALSVMTIQQLVAAEWGVTPEGLQSKTRTKTLTTPRQVAMFLCRELLGLQLVEIGNAFGGRDHSTVIHSLERAQEMVAE